MNTQQQIKEQIQEIDAIFGNDWFKQFCKRDETFLKGLSLEEKVISARTYTVPTQTHLFRHELSMAVLEHCAVPAIHRRPVRIASVGCCTGLELYSILIQHWTDRKELVFHGYDINPDIVQEANNLHKKVFHLEGHKLKEWEEYRARADAHTGAGAYTISRNQKYSYTYNVQLTQEASSRMSFSLHDIALAPLPTRYDIIFLQNVLGHYARRGRERILHNIHQSLASKGWLICEPGSFWGNAPGGKEYQEEMRNLRAQGFQKKRTVLSWGARTKTDMSWASRAYRKI